MALVYLIPDRFELWLNTRRLEDDREADPRADDASANTTESVIERDPTPSIEDVVENRTPTADDRSAVPMRSDADENANDVELVNPDCTRMYPSEDIVSVC